MNSMSTFLTNGISAILLSAVAIPILLELIYLAAIFLHRQVTYRSHATEGFQTLANAGNRLDSSSMENIEKLESALTESKIVLPKPLQNRWELMKVQIDLHYHGPFLPECKAFFPSDQILEWHSPGKQRDDSSQIFWLFSLLALALPVTFAYIFRPIFLWEALGFGVLGLILLALLRLLFILLEQLAQQSLQTEYFRFTDVFDRVIPVAHLASVAILEASRREGAIAKEILLPSLQASLDVISQKQEHGMAILAGEFVSRLTDTLEDRMLKFSSSIKDIQTELVSLKDILAENVHLLNQLMETDRTALDDAGHKILAASQEQSAVFAHTAEAQKHALELANEFQHKAKILNELQLDQMNRLSKAVERLAEQHSSFGGLSVDLIQKANQIQTDISAQLLESQNQISGAVLQIDNTFAGITDNMNGAMISAGREIALGIKEVTADNAEAISRLAEQSLKLQQEYDNYFSNLETHSHNSLEEMDFHVQNILSKVSEELGAMLFDQRIDNKTTLETYQESTANLLLSFEQQANSISLYAKEINLDIHELSTNLKESVSEFSDDMTHSVKRTLEEFDAGLAELSLRISNTVESICDAVEELPSALRKQS